MDNTPSLSSFLKIDNYQKFYHNNKYLLLKIILMVFIGGFLIHSFRAHQTAFAYDALVGINFYDAEISYKLNSGRYLALFNVFFRGAIAHPLLLTTLSFFWISLAIFSLAKLFNIKSNTFILALAALFLTQRSYIFSQAVLIHEVDIFMLAQLLSILAIFVAYRFKKGYLFTPLFVCLVCTAYQAYLCYILGLASIVLIYNILKGTSLRENATLSLRLFLPIATGLILYYLLVQFRINVLANTISTAYNAPEQALSFWNQDVLAILSQCVRIFYTEIVATPTHNAIVSSLLNITLIAFSSLATIIICTKKQINGMNLALLFACILSLPFFLHVVTILSLGMTSASMRCAFELIYILCLLPLFHPVLSSKIRKISQSFAIIFIAIITFNNAIYANQLYLRIALDADKSNMISNRIIYEIEHTDGYIPKETPVIFIGSPSKNEMILSLSGTVGKYKEFPLDSPLIYETNLSYAPAYFRQIMGYPIKIQDFDKERDTALAEGMPSFPHAGYCRMHEGRIYIKMADIHT